MTSVESELAPMDGTSQMESGPDKPVESTNDGNHGSDDPWWKQSGGPMFWLVCLLGTLPLALTYWIGLLGDSQYAFLPLPFVLIGYLYWSRSQSTMSRPQSVAGWSMVATAFLILMLGILVAFPWFGAFAFVLVAATALSTVRGNAQRSLTGLIAPLLSLSIPVGLAGLLSGWINRSSAWLSSIFLDYFEMPHSVAGSVIRLFESEVVVSRICGGFVSFAFVMFVAFAFMAWKRMSLWLLPIYAVAAIVVTLAVNTLRVVLSVIVAESLELDLSEGWYPTLLSAGAAIVSIGLLYSFQHLFAIIFHHVEPNNESGLNPLVQGWNKFSWMNENRAMEERSMSDRRDEGDEVEPSLAPQLWYGLIGTASLLGLLSLTAAFRSTPDDSQQLASTGPLFAVTETLFKDLDTSESFQLKEFVPDDSPETSDTAKRIAGQKVDQWKGEYQQGNLTLQIVQPITGWIEITRGYQSAGWEIIDRNTDSIEVALGDEEQTDTKTTRRRGRDLQREEEEVEEEFNAFATARMRGGSEGELEGYLFYSAVDRDGRVVETPTALSSMWDSLQRRLGTSSEDALKAAAMIQVFVVSPQKLSPRDLRTLKREYVKHREAVAKAIAAKEPQS